MNEHVWESARRGLTPVLICEHCKKVWYPDQFKPRTLCRPKSTVADRRHG